MSPKWSDGLALCRPGETLLGWICENTNRVWWAYRVGGTIRLRFKNYPEFTTFDMYESWQALEDECIGQGQTVIRYSNCPKRVRHGA